MTTRDSLESMRVQIPWAKLPRTIKDAIDVTRALGIQYLWVDALCIIQDSLKDWRAEAAKMASVYGGAFLTISAALGPDVDHGLFRTTSQLASGSNTSLADEPLYKRAWALQERVLSPRVLIFGSDKLYWECQTKQFKIVRDYTYRLLTKETDKLPALEGLAVAYGTATGKSYIKGLWKESLLDDLLWQQHWLSFGNMVEPSLPGGDRAPSWSWASLDGNTSKPISTKMKNLYTEVLSTYDDATKTTICLQGPLLQTRLENGYVMFGNHQVNAQMDHRTLDDTLETRRKWKTLENLSNVWSLLLSTTGRPDTFETRRKWKRLENLSNVWCLLLGTTGRLDSMEGHGLILVRAEEATTERGFDMYTRIGRFLLSYPSPTNVAAIWESTAVACGKSKVYII